MVSEFPEPMIGLGFEKLPVEESKSSTKISSAGFSETKTNSPRSGSKIMDFGVNGIGNWTCGRLPGEASILRETIFPPLNEIK